MSNLPAPSKHPTRCESAHAKLNLALAVGPPDATGMHEICSWFAPIELSDTITMTRLENRAPSTISIDWAPDAPVRTPIDWPVESDLAWRARALTESLAGCTLPVAIQVLKRIPTGGGLGGGSSDAATVMLLLRSMFELPLDDATLADASRSLGSDVGFFIDGDGTRAPCAAIVSGLGDRIERVDHVPGAFVLIMPPFGCPTGAVYRAFDATGDQSPLAAKAAKLRAIVQDALGSPTRFGADLFNDLAGPACGVAPELGPLRNALSTACGQAVHVTGSGSTLFIPARNDADAQRLAGLLGPIVADAGSQLVLTHTLGPA